MRFPKLAAVEALYFSILIIVAFSAYIVGGVVNHPAGCGRAEPKDAPFGCPEFLFNRYQTLIVGLAALAVAIWGGKIAFAQLKKLGSQTSLQAAETLQIRLDAFRSRYTRVKSARDRIVAVALGLKGFVEPNLHEWRQEAAAALWSAKLDLLDVTASEKAAVATMNEALDDAAGYIAPAGGLLRSLMSDHVDDDLRRHRANGLEIGVHWRFNAPLARTEEYLNVLKGLIEKYALAADNELESAGVDSFKNATTNETDVENTAVQNSDR